MVSTEYQLFMQVFFLTRSLVKVRYLLYDPVFSMQFSSQAVQSDNVEISGMDLACK